MSGLSNKLPFMSRLTSLIVVIVGPGDKIIRPSWLFIKLYLFPPRFTKCISECLGMQVTS
jgi:hypothetical protein